MADLFTFFVTLLATILCFTFATVSIFRKLKPSNSGDDDEMPALIPVDDEHSVLEISNSASSGIEFIESQSSDDDIEFEGRRPVELPTIEDMVPEIITQILGYLDFRSLCCLSMVNSSMRESANSNDLWRERYSRDLNPEHEHIVPPNSWKAYYATTRDVLVINVSYFRFIREKRLYEMSQLWLNADYVKCLHESAVLYCGYNEIKESLGLMFNWHNNTECAIVDARPRVWGDTAWVTMKNYGTDFPPFHVTNVFERHNGRWYLVMHHSSPTILLTGGQVPLLALLGE